ncbi:MAG: ATP-binding protein [Treponema sp.]|uniref:ATP-binding protein n=1 Tax=Treponema sp. TaxID=166 RepID=UPI00298EB557|nr:ATP-binding protein [Treponema sp.]MCQ2601443.1 ATP-binding protein [Treponema sp.]
MFDTILDLSAKFPVVTLTGPRQCGKSTLLKSCFADYKYISLEDPDVRQIAENDPRGFLRDCGTRCIIDEAQRAPDLFSYIQTIVDSRDECGQFILSGSHNFLLMERISQSLAGRTGVLKLFPFSIGELREAGKLPNDLDEILLNGCFPRLYDKKISAKEYFSSYLQTYVERDVRLLRNITDMTAFKRFLKLCAANVGSVMNVASLAKDAGISVITANSWISILEASFVLLRLPPYYKNFSKRIVKSSKIYFCDTGLLCNLLNIFNRKQLQESGLRGTIFENFVFAEYMKAAAFKGEEPQLYFWRDTNQNEVDLLCESDGRLSAIEIKSGETKNQKFYDGLKKFAKIADIPLSSTSVVYGGSDSYRGENQKFISWMEM